MRAIDKAIFRILRRLPARDEGQPSTPDIKDEELWRTSEEGRHFKFESETGEIKAGFGGKLNGQKLRPKASQQTQQENAGATGVNVEATKVNTEAPKANNETANEETDLYDLFSDIWDNPDAVEKSLEKEKKQWEQAEKEQKERREYGQNGLTENEYPENLRLSKEERETVNNVLREYREDGFDSGVSHEVIEALQGRLSTSALENVERGYKQQIKEAEEMIKQRKDEGYSYKENHKGETGEERLEAWYRYFLENDRPPEGVGKKGIQHWQKQRKNAKNALEQLEFAKKLAKRREYAEGNDNYMNWENNPNSENSKYKPWAK